MTFLVGSVYEVLVCTVLVVLFSGLFILIICSDYTVGCMGKE